MTNPLPYGVSGEIVQAWLDEEVTAIIPGTAAEIAER
jgi:hypothetical protein